MTIKNLFLINGITCLIFGIPLLLAPDKLLEFYMTEGDRLGNMGMTIARSYGTILTGLGIALLTARKAQASYGRKALLLIIMVVNILALIIYLQAILGGLVNNMVWSNAILVAALGIWGGLLWSKEKIVA